LQEAHLLSVPFENLDIHAGKRIVLEPDILFNKIVVMKRGGFCYELNGLFFLLLQEFGFCTTLAMGRVYDRRRSAYGPEFDHMLILADVDSETWLVDVGFGDFAMHPLKLALNQPLADRNGQFIIERTDDEYFRVSRFSAGERLYLPEYLFSTKERCLAEFADRCLYHQTSPESHFTKQRICSIATATGRTTLTDEKLLLTEGGVRTEFAIRSALEFGHALTRYFNIVP
jgi:N-hydroxyarylamine O-acetyltransferase